MNMNINQDTLSGKWKEIKGEIRRKWGQVTESDIDETKGNAQSLVGLLQQKLGVAKDEATRHVYDLTEKYRSDNYQTNDPNYKRSMSDKVSDKVNDTIDSVKNKLKH